ncbi:MAG: hypothetical protein AAF734_06765 [Bacteroidota bacterium]
MSDLLCLQLPEVSENSLTLQLTQIHPDAPLNTFEDRPKKFNAHLWTADNQLRSVSLVLLMELLSYNGKAFPLYRQVCQLITHYYQVEKGDKSYVPTDELDAFGASPFLHINPKVISQATLTNLNTHIDWDWNEEKYQRMPPYDKAKNGILALMPHYAIQMQLQYDISTSGLSTDLIAFTTLSTTLLSWY